MKSVLRPAPRYLKQYHLVIAAGTMMCLSPLGCKTSTGALESIQQGGSSTGGAVPSFPNSSASGSGQGTDSSATGECMHGSVRNCSQTPAGEAIVFPGGAAKGACKEGTQRCEGSLWGACQGAVGPQPEDSCEPGNDDNCNGIRNDHCSCVSGETQACGSSTGACEEGLQTCLDNGTWNQNCEGEVGSKPEQCDGKGVDEDCDGAVDDKDSDCACNDGDQRACDIEDKQGDCELGVQTCRQGVWLESCEPRFEAVTEICGPRASDDVRQLPAPTGDEDCDGRVDESDVDNDFNPAGPDELGTYYMVDEDGDGWGAMRSSGERESDVARRYCKGREKDVPPGWTASEKNRLQRDCGDCTNDGEKVRPDYDGGFTTQINYCLKSLGWKGGPFDYNCSGREELQFTEMFRCEVDSPTCLDDRRGGWAMPSVPKCGEEGNWLERENCTIKSPDFPGCSQVQVFNPKVQACQ